MSSDDQWTKWTTHDGKGCPLQVGQITEMKMACGCVTDHIVRDTDFITPLWKHTGFLEPAVCTRCDAFLVGPIQPVDKYRVKKPDALLKLIEDIKHEETITDPDAIPDRVHVDAD